MKYIYVPGCALMAYKKNLALELRKYAVAKYGPMETLLTCCFDQPELEPGTCILTPCVTCAHQYLKNDPDCTSRILLEDLAGDDTFPFPDYQGVPMSIQDTCAARTDPGALEAVRTLLRKMNISLVEPAKSGTRAKCCGQVLYGKASLGKVEQFMQTRAGEMPCEEVVTYCASCNMSMAVGGRRPRFLLDLVYGLETKMDGVGVCSWNEQIRDFRLSHRNI